MVQRLFFDGVDRYRRNVRIDERVQRPAAVHAGLSNAALAIKDYASERANIAFNFVVGQFLVKDALLHFKNYLKRLRIELQLANCARLG